MKLQKIVAILMCTVLLMGMSVNAFATPTVIKASNSIDIIDLFENPEKHPDTELVFYDSVDDYVDAVATDENLTEETKSRLINDARSTEHMEAREYVYKYLKIKQTVKVTKDYYVYPYFYTQFYFMDGSPSPLGMEEVKNANVDRNYNGKSKAFEGTLYYNLESENSLYWDLNGDFFNRGAVTVTGGGTIGIKGIATAEFAVSSPQEFFAYVQADDKYTMG